MRRFLLALLASFAIAFSLAAAESSPVPQQRATYEDQVLLANELFKRNQLGEALASAQSAAKLNPKRYEAPSVAALILLSANRPAEAKAAADEALALAPAEKKEKVQSILGLIAAKAPKSNFETANEMVEEALVRAPAEKRETLLQLQNSFQGDPSALPVGPELSREAKRKLEVLKLIIIEADEAKNPENRRQLLLEYLKKSDEFLKSNTNVLQVWTVRAAIGIGLQDPQIGWQAGQRMLVLGAEESKNPRVEKTVLQLERKGWLTPSPPLVTKNLLSPDGMNKGACRIPARAVWHLQTC